MSGPASHQAIRRIRATSEPVFTTSEACQADRGQVDGCDDQTQPGSFSTHTSYHIEGLG